MSKQFSKEHATPTVAEWKYKKNKDWWNSGHIEPVSRFWVELLWINELDQHQCSNTDSNKRHDANVSYKPCEKAGSGISAESSNRRG